MRVPLALIREQGPMLKTLARVLFSTVIGAPRPSANPDDFPAVRRRLPAPSRRLIRHYAAWCGAPEQRYAAILPPHLFTQFALPLWAVQLEMTRYPLARIINQGCGLVIHRNIPVGTGLEATASVADITESDNRARVHQRLSVGTGADAGSITVDFHTAFILGQRSGKHRVTGTQTPMETVASWDAGAGDGLQFALLTGDLNPVHWIGAAARLSPFKGKVMHGFGVFARSYELLQNATHEAVRAIEVRFVRPVRLPNRGLHLMRAKTTDSRAGRALALVDARGAVLMAGRYTGASARCDSGCAEDSA